MAEDDTSSLTFPESYHVEYWGSRQPEEFLARQIAGFANTEGGAIVIGAVPIDTGQIYFHGFSLNEASSIAEEAKAALHFLLPKPLINPHVRKVRDNHYVVIIEVQKYPTPVLFEDGKYFVRNGDTVTLAEQDLIDALSKAVPSIKPNILNSLQTEEPGTEKSENIGKSVLDIHAGVYNIFPGSIGDVAGSNINRYIHKTIEEKPHLDLTELLSDSIKRTREDLTTQRNERLHQARITFIVALVVLVLAILLVFIGVLLIFTNKAQEGVVSSVASVVSGIVSGLVLVFNKQANDRMDEYAKELVTLEKSYTAMQYISYITDVKVKDEAIRDLAKNISLGNQVGK